MSPNRHKHRNAPRIANTKAPVMEITERGYAALFPSLSRGGHVYHPTKGWRRLSLHRGDVYAYENRFARLLSRAFA